MSGENEDIDTELPVFDDGPTEDIEIEITEEELGENFADFPEDEAEEDGEPIDDEGEEEEPIVAEQEEEEEEEEEKPKRRRSSENRIAELARRAADAERRVAEAEARAQQEAARAFQSDVAMMQHYEQRLVREASAVKSQLQEAISIGDTAQQVELQSQLFQLQSDISGVESWKQEMVNRQPAPVAQPAPTQSSQQQVSLEPTTAAWIESNSWFQPQSPNFDAEMHEEATQYARKIERRYRASGRADEIGGAKYFKEIDAYIREEFPDAFEPAVKPKKATPQMSRNTPVAPVTRTSAPGQPAKNSRTIQLSVEQRKMSHSLAAAGAIKLPNGGRPNNLQAEKIYAIELMKNNRR